MTSRRRYPEGDSEVIFELKSLTYIRYEFLLPKEQLFEMFDQYAARGELLEKVIVHWRRNILETRGSFRGREKIRKIRAILVREVNTGDYSMELISHRPTQIRHKMGAECIRQSYMNHLMELGATIQSVAKLVGHRSVGSTVKCAKNGCDHVKNNLSQKPPKR